MNPMANTFFKNLFIEDDKVKMMDDWSCAYILFMWCLFWSCLVVSLIVLQVSSRLKEEINIVFLGIWFDDCNWSLFCLPHVEDYTFHLTNMNLLSSASYAYHSLWLTLIIEIGHDHRWCLDFHKIVCCCRGLKLALAFSKKIITIYLKMKFFVLQARATLG
jgi:hypothetical protein